MRAVIVGGVLLALLAARAEAIEYEARIEIETADDLYDLEVSEDISPETFTALVELLRSGVDLDTADSERLYLLPGLSLADVDAIIRYRTTLGGHIEDPEQLVTAGVITEDKMRQISAFLITGAHGGLGISGTYAGSATWTIDDKRVPASEGELKLRLPYSITVGGALVLTRNRLSDPVWDPVRQSLVADGPAARLNVPKVYALWQSPDVDVILGSYRIGFGQRLVFDSTDQVTPNGFYADDTIFRGLSTVRKCVESGGETGGTPCPSTSQQYVTPDDHWREGQFGIAVQARHISLGGAGWLQLAGFASNQVHQIYQYEIYDKNKCADPRNDSDPACAAPAVYKNLADPFEPATDFTFETLPNMWSELMAGGNATYFFDRRTHVGVTGYGADPNWLVKGANLDFQEWSRFPFGGAYGAAGADAAYGFGMYDLTVEVGHSFDKMINGGGGVGFITRETATWPHNELELAFRYYDKDFANPYAGSIAEPDQLDGQTARDEVGPRLRYTATLGALTLRALADFWVQPSLGIPKLLTYVRSDYQVTGPLSLGLWLLYENKDLGTTAPGQCFSATVDMTDDGQPIPCKGKKYQVRLRGTLEPARRLSFSLDAQLSLLDDPHDGTDLRKDVAIYLLGTYYIGKQWRLHLRTRYLNQDISDNAYLETSIWSYFDLTYQQPRSWLVRARYDYYQYLDDRASTLVRDPNPEHWLRVEFEGKF